MATAARWSRARHQVSRLPFHAIIHASHSNLGGAVGTFPQKFVFVFAPHSGLSSPAYLLPYCPKHPHPHTSPHSPDNLAHEAAARTTL